MPTSYPDNTSPGQTAKEKGEHGLFTAAILEHIMVPNITIENMFKRVRNTVYICYICPQ